MCIVIVENSNRQHFLTPVCNTIKWNYTTGINGFNWTNYGLRGKRLKIHAKLYKVFSLNNTWDLTKYLWENISQMVKQCSTVIPYTNTITWGFFLFVFLSRFLFRDLNGVYLGQDWAVCYIYTDFPSSQRRYSFLNSGSNSGIHQKKKLQISIFPMNTICNMPRHSKVLKWEGD